MNIRHHHQGGATQAIHQVVTGLWIIDAHIVLITLPAICDTWLSFLLQPIVIWVP
jgi:hypothetical protein